MALYPPGAGDRAVTHRVLDGVVQAIFRACGASPADAELIGGSLVDADLRGVHSHGVIRVPDYVKKLTEEGVDPKGRPQILREDAAAVVVDGGNSMGQVGGSFAMGEAIRRARQYGVGVAALGHSNHCGAMDFFTRPAAEEGFIGLATTNALPTMAPWGGREKIVGINPLSIAMPSDEPHPLIIDMAFGATAHGKIRVYAQKKQPIPEGWALDSAGKPTTDAEAALDGLIQPIGAFKGVGLAVMMGAFSSMLSGAAYGTELGNMVEGPKPGRDGQFFAAIRISAFEDPALFRQRIGGIIRQIRDCPRAPGVDRIYAPGALEHEFETRYRREGITLSAETLNAVIAEAERLGINARELGPA